MVLSFFIKGILLFSASISEICGKYIPFSPADPADFRRFFKIID